MHNTLIAAFILIFISLQGFLFYKKKETLVLSVFVFMSALWILTLAFSKMLQSLVPLYPFAVICLFLNIILIRKAMRGNI